jgi:hypothetical protein
MTRFWFAAATGLAALVFAAVTCYGTSGAIENGAEEMMIDSGSKGSVFFPHRRHQEADAITCLACHELFPQEPGSISRLIVEGDLKSRQVMNSQCISCHRKTRAAGNPSGPRSCSACHK